VIAGDDMKRLFLAVMMVIVSLCLCQGCSVNRTYYQKVQLMTPADYKAKKLIEHLQGQGVNVSLSNGEDKNALGTVKLLVKNTDLFNKDSANFNSKALAILDNVISLLNCYDEEIVKIQDGFSNRYTTNNKYTAALMLARAHEVARYLWLQDINATFTYAISGEVPIDYVSIVFQKFRLRSCP